MGLSWWLGEYMNGVDTVLDFHSINVVVIVRLFCRYCIVAIASNST